MHHHRITTKSARRLVVATLLALSALSMAGTTTATAGGGICHANGPSTKVTSGTGLTADIQANCYTPTVLHVQPGDGVTWTNRDELPHTVTGLYGSWGNNSQFGRGQSVRFQFDAAGTFPYYCVLHPTMQGVVVVGDGRASSTTGSTQPVASSIAPTIDQSAAPTASTPLPAARGGSTAFVWGLGGLLVGTLATGAGMTLGRRRV